MKKDIHPKYGPAVITCACGNKLETASTVSAMEVEICSACHPFYTGQKKIVDTAGRVDRFNRRMERAKNLQEGLKKKKVAKAAKQKKPKLKLEIKEVKSKKNK